MRTEADLVEQVVGQQDLGDCWLLWPDPVQRGRLEGIRDNLIARIAEAERESGLGKVEGLQVSLAGAARPPGT